MAVNRLKVSLTDMIRNERKLNHIKFSVKTREARKRVAKKKETRTQSMEQKIVTITLDINPTTSPVT